MSSPLSHFSYADSAKDKDGPQIGLLTKITKRQYVLLKLNRLSIFMVVFLVIIILFTHLFLCIIISNWLLSINLAFKPDSALVKSVCYFSYS